MEKLKEKHTCQLCNKKYSSIYSFSNHRRIYHGNGVKDNKRTKNEQDELYHCRYCDKKYSMRNSRWRHEKTCNNSIDKDNLENNDILIAKCDNLKDEIICLQSKIIQNLYKPLNNNL